MSEHKTKTAPKGDGYKKVQAIQPRPLRIKAAPISAKWMERHGYRLRDDGKWEKKFK